ncbi:MAG: hypothetical protein F4234_11375 [Gammaproteobacteria bacterium]|nr:hypothetical protein [Gammaproteobacteria bacterium]MYA66166.1 hypothetical protein [Gammaproteobacteria bacterium]MYC59267.1 hypothetical protein [Gammaproteobacteria bacterium]MYF00748.1 hypothetical protein [Gammaproteobacteria bacterium]MYG96599.1 hypothetical protein [Gammaproteobacteria bacterium]
MEITDSGPTLVFSFDGTGNEPCDTGKFERDESTSMADLVNSALAPKWGDARRILNEAWAAISRSRIRAARAKFEIC